MLNVKETDEMRGPRVLSRALARAVTEEELTQVSGGCTPGPTNCVNAQGQPVSNDDVGGTCNL